MVRKKWSIWSLLILMVDSEIPGSNSRPVSVQSSYSSTLWPIWLFVLKFDLHIKRLNSKYFDIRFVKTMELLHPDLSGFDKDRHEEWSVTIANNLGKLFNWLFREFCWLWPRISIKWFITPMVVMKIFHLIIRITPSVSKLWSKVVVMNDSCFG